MDRIGWPDDAGRLLVEEDRDRRRRHPRFLHMVGVVETDREEFRRARHRRREPYLGEGEARRPADGGLARRRHRVGAAGEQRDHVARQPGARGQIHDLVALDHADPSGSAMSEGHELHVVSRVLWKRPRRNSSRTRTTKSSRVRALVASMPMLSWARAVTSKRWLPAPRKKKRRRSPRIAGSMRPARCPLRMASTKMRNGARRYRSMR